MPWPCLPMGSLVVSNLDIISVCVCEGWGEASVLMPNVGNPWTFGLIILWHNEECLVGHEKEIKIVYKE